jgi:dolichol kinase
MAIVLVVTAAMLLTPRLAIRFAAITQLKESVSGRDERWGGLVLYSASFTWMTWMGLRDQPFPAAAALLALALGDGVGGAIGRRFGRLHFTAPGGKRKSLEGSLAVAVAAAAGGWIASTYFQVTPSLQTLLAIGLIASVAEALAPRASDNLLVPAAVSVFLRLNG